MSRNPIIPYRPALRALARKLRKNSTLGEVLIWKEIKKKKLGVQFHRQVPIDAFIVDFYCHEIKMSIEIDGSSHDNPQNYQRDEERQKQLESLGIRIVRIDDNDVRRNLNAVIDYLQAIVDECIG